MKKLHLKVDSLRVESFGTDGAGEARGTVAAHNTNAGYTCVYHCTFRGFTCEGDATCGCLQTLNATCLC